MLQYRKSIPALVLKSFPHIILSHDGLTSFSITIHEMLPQKLSFHAKFKFCVKILPNHCGIRFFFKLERNFQHWFASNKTLGNVFTLDLLSGFENQQEPKGSPGSISPVPVSIQCTVVEHVNEGWTTPYDFHVLHSSISICGVCFILTFNVICRMQFKELFCF